MVQRFPRWDHQDYPIDQVPSMVRMRAFEPNFAAQSRSKHGYTQLKTAGYVWS